LPPGVLHPVACPPASGRRRRAPAQARSASAQAHAPRSHAPGTGGQRRSASPAARPTDRQTTPREGPRARGAYFFAAAAWPVPRASDSASLAPVASWGGGFCRIRRPGEPGDGPPAGLPVSGGVAPRRVGLGAGAAVPAPALSVAAEAGRGTRQDAERRAATRGDRGWTGDVAAWLAGDVRPAVVDWRRGGATRVRPQPGGVHHRPGALFSDGGPHPGPGFLHQYGVGRVLFSPLLGRGPGCGRAFCGPDGRGVTGCTTVSPISSCGLLASRPWAFATSLTMWC